MTFNTIRKGSDTSQDKYPTRSLIWEKTKKPTVLPEPRLCAHVGGSTSQ